MSGLSIEGGPRSVEMYETAHHTRTFDGLSATKEARIIKKQRVAAKAEKDAQLETSFYSSGNF